MRRLLTKRWSAPIISPPQGLDACGQKVMRGSGYLLNRETLRSRVEVESTGETESCRAGLARRLVEGKTAGEARPTD